jgi:rubrerythrin
MSHNKETVGELFEYAIALEKAAETVYTEFGNMFAHSPEVAAFWRSYADEERGHASYLERIKGKVDGTRLSYQADVTILEKVHSCLRKISSTQLATMRTLQDAFELATELENSETNTIFEFMIMNFTTDELAESHKFLRTQLSSHIAKLENGFPTEYKSRIARQGMLVKENSS